MMGYEGRYQVSAGTRGGVYRACLCLPTEMGQVVICAEMPHALLAGLRTLAAAGRGGRMGAVAEVGFDPLTGSALLGGLLGGGQGGGLLGGLLGGGRGGQPGQGGQGGGGLLGGLLGGGGGGGLLGGLLGGGQRQPQTHTADGRARPGAMGAPDIAPGTPPTQVVQIPLAGQGGQAMGGQAGGQTPAFDTSWVPVGFTTGGVPLYRHPPGVQPSGQSPMGQPIYPSGPAMQALEASGGNRPDGSGSGAASPGLPGLTGMAGGAMGGAIPPELAAPYLGAANALGQGIAVYNDIMGPVALLLRQALRAVDAGAGAELGHPIAIQALARARGSAEQRVAEALRIAGALVQGGATPGAALGTVAQAV